MEERNEKVTNRSSNRSFGVIMAGFFLLVGVAPVIAGGIMRNWALAMSLLFILLTVCIPAVLAPLNNLWFKFGLLLHRLISPIVLGTIYFLLITPLGALMRFIGAETLSRGFDSSKESYWIKRTPPGPAAETLKNQF